MGWESSSLKCTTTTVQINRIRGYSLDILSELQHTVLTGPEIAELTDRKYGYTKRYLYNLYKYGCVDRIERWSWKITPLGAEILSTNTNTKNGERRVKEEGKKSERRVKETSHNSCTTPTWRQLNIDLFLQQQEDLSENQRVVVVALANKYEKTGRPYLMVKSYYEFAEQVGLSERMDHADIQDLVISLDVAGIVYTFRKGDYMKIGLLKQVVNNLQYC